MTLAKSLTIKTHLVHFVFDTPEDDSELVTFLVRSSTTKFALSQDWSHWTEHRRKTFPELAALNEMFAANCEHSQLISNIGLASSWSELWYSRL